MSEDKLTRRDLLAASAAIPVAAAVGPPGLTPDELRVLATTATPPSAWRGREAEYAERIASPGTNQHRILVGLKARGLVAFTDTPWRPDMDCFATPTPEGYAALARYGVYPQQP